MCHHTTIVCVFVCVCVCVCWLKSTGVHSLFSEVYVCHHTIWYIYVYKKIIRPYIHIYIIHTYIHTTHVYIHKCIYVYLYMCMCNPNATHTHTHTHTQPYVSSYLNFFSFFPIFFCAEWWRRESKVSRKKSCVPSHQVMRAFTF